MNPPQQPGFTSGAVMPAGFLAAYFFGVTTFGAVFWSLFMALWLGRPFAHVLLPVGIGFGLFLGIAMTAAIAIGARREAVVVACPDREAFVSRLDRELRRLRYRPLDRSESALTYRPKGPIGAKYFHLAVELVPDAATITGPWQHVRALKRRLERP